MKADVQRRLFFIALAATTVFAAILRLRDLGGASLWYDEILTAENVSRGPVFLLQRVMGLIGPLPLSFLFPWLADPTGRSEFLLRLPDALFGIMTVPLAALAAWRLGRSYFAAFASAMIVAVSQHLIYYSREARGYALLAFLALLAFVLLVQALEDGRRRWWVALACASIAGHYTSYFYCFTQLALGCWGVGWLACAAERKELSRADLKSRAWSLAAALLVSTGVFVPWVLLVVRSFGQYAREHPAPLSEAASTTLVSDWLERVAYSWLPAFWGWRVVAGGLVVLGDCVMIPKRRGLLSLTAALPIGAASFCFSLSTSGHFLAHRYAIEALPLFAVGCGLGLAALIRLAGKAPTIAFGFAPRAWIQCAAAATAAALLALNAGAQWKVYLQFFGLEKQDWRTAVGVIQKRFVAGDLIVPSISGNELCLHHYAPPALNGYITSSEDGRPARILETLREAGAHGLGVWYVIPESSLSDDPAMILMLSQNMKRIAIVPGEQPIGLYYRPRP